MKNARNGRRGAVRNVVAKVLILGWGGMLGAGEMLPRLDSRSSISSTPSRILAASTNAHHGSSMCRTSLPIHTIIDGELEVAHGREGTLPLDPRLV